MNISKFITIVFVTAVYTSSIWGLFLNNTNARVMSMIVCVFSSVSIVSWGAYWIVQNWNNNEKSNGN